MDNQEFVKAFEEKLMILLDTVKKKNADYSGENAKNAFRNFEAVAQFWFASVVQGFLTRLTDKMMRIGNLVKQDPHVKGESIHDTLKDIAAYCIIMDLWLETQRLEKVNRD